MKSAYRFLYLIPNFIILKWNKVSFASFSFYGMVWIRNSGHISFGERIKINSHPTANVIGGDIRTCFVVRKGAAIIVGSNVSISNSTFCSADKIIIEDYVMIGGSCKIWDSDFHPMDPETRKRTPNQNFISKPIHIKQSAFIGGSSIILKGVTIGKNAVVGAGSVVSKDIPDNEIWAGNPARFIKKIDVHG